jgi:uncharacterized membrane protein HdeD (DUF308 family)
MTIGIVRLLKYNPPAQSKSRTGYLHSVERSAGTDPRRWSRRSWIAFLGGLGLVAAALIATGAFPVLSTLTALVGIAAMIYGVVAGVMVVFNRDDDGPPD